MIRRYALALAILPLVGHAADAPGRECAAPGHYNESMLSTSVKNDLGVALVEREKIALEVLDLSPVSDVLARQLAKADSKAGKGLSENDYYGIYHGQGVLNLTAKYTYINSKGKRDVFIASSLLNDDECSVRFNGYMTLSREF